MIQMQPSHVTGPESISRSVTDLINHMGIRIDAAHLAEIRIFQRRSIGGFLPDHDIAKRNIFNRFFVNSENIGSSWPVFTA